MGMIQARHWEHHLMDLAFQALESRVLEHTVNDEELLQAAYSRCEGITKESSKTFFAASSLMPYDKRQATRALYAFCRVSDDIVDRPDASSEPGQIGIRSTGVPDTDAWFVSNKLENWRRYVTDQSGSLTASTVEREVCLAWADTRRRYAIPDGYIEQLLEGLACDLSLFRYQNFIQLSQYCYRVACTVGLMSMHITGYSSPAAISFAIRLGVALQLTNILRDVGEDWRAGRLYLPLEELDAFGLSEADIAAGVVTERWRSFMRFQIARTRRLYSEAMPGVSLLNRDGRFSIAAAGELYGAILEQIEANDYNVFDRRASVSGFGKLSRLPGVWWRANVAQYIA